MRLVRGIRPTLMARPDGLYFWFRQPIDTQRFTGRRTMTGGSEMRNLVKASVEDEIAFLSPTRTDHPARATQTALQSAPKDS